MKIFIIIIVILAVWAFLIEPNLLVVNQVNIKIKDMKGLKIVFVGDFHIKPYQKQSLKRIVKKINEQHPDLILCAGDFVSGHKPKQSLPIEDIAKELSALKSKYGVYAVLGNHDWWQDGDKIKKILEKNGIIVLGNENRAIDINGKKLYIAGAEDISMRDIDLVKSLENISSPVILLTHSPDIFPLIAKKSNFDLTNKIDLTLAGHVHGGQVSFPFIGPLVIPSSYGSKYAKGLIRENGKLMFVTKGIGTSILPVRFNCVPEIIVINLV